MRGTVIAFFAIALFSLYAIFGKILLTTVNPLIILVLNNALAGVILILVLDLLKKLKELKETPGKDIRLAYFISLFSAVGGPLLFLMGLKLTSATNTILIGKSEAVLTSIIAIFILKEKVTLHQITGAVIMFLGVAVIATKGFSLGLSLNLGDILVFLSACSYAIATILFKKYMDHLPPEVLVTFRNLFGASMLFVLSLFLVDWNFVGILNPGFILALLGLVVLTTIAGQYLWYKALEMTSATNVSLAGLSSPLIAIIYAVFLLGESLSQTQVAGGMLILVGLCILEFHFRIVHTEKKHKHHLKLKHWPHI